jgi:hypothetical protein
MVPLPECFNIFLYFSELQDALVLLVGETEEPRGRVNNADKK